MGKSPAKHELILLFDNLGYEPKKMHKWLKERGQDYSIWTLRKYYYYYTAAKMIAQSILRGK